MKNLPGKDGHYKLRDQVAWRTPAADPAAIKTDKLEGELGSRMYNKETGRLAQYGLEQQVNWPTPHGFMGQGADGKYGEGGEFAKAVKTSVPVRHWPTPNVPNRGAESRASKSNRPQAGGIDLQTEVGNGSTPQARDHKGADLPSRVGKPGLPDQVKSSTNGKSRGLWPTPCTPGEHSIGAVSEWGGSKNPMRNNPTNHTAKLNPDWVEQLMGVPVGWTDLGSWEMESAPSKQKKRSGALAKGACDTHD